MCCLYSLTFRAKCETKRGRIDNPSTGWQLQSCAKAKAEIAKWTFRSRGCASVCLFTCYQLIASHTNAASKENPKGWRRAAFARQNL
jgi:hypothetical protein